MAEHFEKVLPYLMPLSEQLFVHLPALPAGTRVLDLACGTGEPAFSLIRRYQAGCRDLTPELSFSRGLGCLRT
jgi:hypothetical protein